MLPVLALGLARGVDAATLTVTKTVDTLDGACDSDCSLREAIVAANEMAGPDEIILPAGKYKLQIPGSGEDAARTGDLDIGDDLTITGAGSKQTSINGNSGQTGDRVIDIGGSPSVRISGLRIRGGDPGGYNSGGGIQNWNGTLDLDGVQVLLNHAFVGGGIYNFGALALTNSRVATNDAAGGCAGLANYGTLRIEHSAIVHNSATGYGAGICNASGAVATIAHTLISDNHASNNSGGGGLSGGGTLLLDSSTLAGNSADGNGGGLFLAAPATIVNSTISGNSTDGDGGGIWSSDGTVSLSNSTITLNTANSNGDGFGMGGGIYNAPGTGVVRVKNTIVAGNLNNGDVAPDCSGTLVSEGYNLLKDLAGCSIAGDLTGNLLGVDARLGLLRLHGGSVVNHSLLSDSPAIEAGNVDGCVDADGSPLATDQRGYGRPADGDRDGSPICDIGAFEFRAVPPISILGDEPPY